jgi:hypothetical protein
MYTERIQINLISLQSQLTNAVANHSILATRYQIDYLELIHL